jgi:hypothetical protein
VRASHNVNLLRWCRYYGIDVSWNIIWGFPGEQEHDYAMQAALLPHLAHLQPPHGANRIWLERFSPLYSDRSRFPVVRLEPEASLAYVYPHSVSQRRVAYFFDHLFPNEVPERVFEPIRAAIRTWEGGWSSAQRPSLVYRWSPGILHIEDGRDPAKPELYEFQSPLADIYRAISDRPQSAANIREALDLPWSGEEIAGALDLFAAKGLVMRDDELFLALAIPAAR